MKFNKKNLFSKILNFDIKFLIYPKMHYSLKSRFLNQSKIDNNSSQLRFDYTEKKSSLNFLELFQDSGMRANVEQIFYTLYNFADLM